MTDPKNPSDKTLSVPPTKTLTLKRSVEQGVVRQSFSHGRSKAVVVETVKRRQAPGVPPSPVKEQAPPPAVAAQNAPVAPAPAARPATPPPPAPASKPTGIVLRELSDDEQSARSAALLEARKREQQDRERQEQEARQRQAREEREREERMAAEARKAEEESRRRHEEDLKRRSEDEARRRLGGETQPRPSAPEDKPAPSSGGYTIGTGGRRPPQINFSRPKPAAERPEGDRPPRPEGERGPRQFGDRPPRQEGERGPRQFGDRPPRPEGERGPRQFGDRPPRQEGERGPRQFGDRPPRPEGERGPRQFGDRPPRQEGERGPRQFGDRPPRPAGGGFPGRGPQVFTPEIPLEPGATRPTRSLNTRPSSTALRDDDDMGGRVARRPGAKVPAPARTPTKPGDDKRRGRLTLTNALSDDEEHTRSVASFRRRIQRMKGTNFEDNKEKLSREVTIPETITVQELANRMSERAVDVVRMMMKQGQMLKITDVIDADTAQLIAEDMGHTVKRVAESDVIEGLFDTPDDPDSLLPRPAVVTIMGHVDHGKTSLLDAIRSANVVAGEAGGITQHIGAYQVSAPSGGKITFIDTPGHAAFTQMRARGAKVTDVVVLVVAADDGVMPQTVEAINHAKAAKVPIIVAINKIDKPEAKPERVRTELLQYEVQVESMGGEVQDVEVSAKNRTNLDGLLESIALQAELLELKANPARAAEGTVIEAKLDRGRGTVATVLVQRGTLRVGDIVVAGSEWGRVRALIADDGQQIKEAGPSVPAEVLGFNGTPDAGDRVAVVESEARAREITDYRQRQKREKQVAKQATVRGSLAEMMKGLKDAAGKKEFPLVIKGDVQGSLEAIVGALEKVGNDEVRARIIHSGVGGITESDITLAEASKAAVIGFNVRAHKEAREAAERTGTEIRYYNIIYDLVDDVKLAMAGLLAPTLREERLGEAQILEVFSVSKIGKVAGCRVMDGSVQRGQHVRLIRDNVVIHEGKLSTLQRFKDAVQEVRAGTECGMAFENYQDMRAGDVIECYRVEEVKRTL